MERFKAEEGHLQTPAAFWGADSRAVERGPQIREEVGDRGTRRRLDQDRALGKGRRALVSE